MHGRPGDRGSGSRFERGQALVEFVLLFPLVMLMLLFMIEFGLALNAQITINSAAREAARFAAVAHLPDAGGGGCDPNSIEQRAVATSANLLTCGEVSVTYLEENADAATDADGDAVVVRITHTHNFLTPLGDFVAAFSFGTLPNSVQVGACSDARLEAVPANQALLAGGVTNCSS